MKLLDYVAIYGLVLMPIGAIVLTEHWLFPKSRHPALPRRTAKLLPTGRRWRFGSERWRLLLTAIHLYFRWLPGWFLAAIGYTVLVKLTAREENHA